MFNKDRKVVDKVFVRETAKAWSMSEHRTQGLFEWVSKIPLSHMRGTALTTLLRRYQNTLKPVRQKKPRKPRAIRKPRQPRQQRKGYNPYERFAGPVKIIK